MWTLACIATATLLWLARFTLGDDLSGPYPGLDEATRYVAIGLSMLAGVRLVHSLLVGVLFKARQGRGFVASDLVRSVLAVALYLVATAVFLRVVLHLDITSVLATSAIFSVILGLALQPTLGHLFSGLSIELERPVRIGDFVRRDQMEGRVISLNWRSVYIQSKSDSIIVLPNGDFTARAVEIIPQERPYRHQVDFSVGSDQPPGKIIRIAMQVACSGLPNVCSPPSPSVVLAGNDPISGTLRYTARLYTLNFLDRGLIASNFLERFWYALSRDGIAMPGLPPAWRAVAADGEATAAQPLAGFRTDLSPSTISIADGTAPEALPAGILCCIPVPLRSSLLACARHLHYGQEESCSGAMIGVVLEGRLREVRERSPAETEAALTTLLAALDTSLGPLDLQAPALGLSMAEYQPMLQQAILALGPLARNLCQRVASLTEDPYLAYRAVARSIPDFDARARFLALAPLQPVRTINPGDWFGWPLALGLESAAPPCHARQSSRLLVWHPDDLAKCLRSADDEELAAFASHLLQHAAGCSALSAADLRAFCGNGHVRNPQPGHLSIQPNRNESACA